MQIIEECNASRAAAKPERHSPATRFRPPQVNAGYRRDEPDNGANRDDRGSQVIGEQFLVKDDQPTRPCIFGIDPVHRDAFDRVDGDQRVALVSVEFRLLEQDRHARRHRNSAWSENEFQRREVGIFLFRVRDPR